MTLIDESLRSIFRQLPTMVCILTGTDDEALYSATISSLVSIDINAQKPLVCFVLKKTSKIGSILKENTRFTISILDARQANVSVKFSQPREKLILHDITDEYCEEGRNYFGIPECFALIKASLVTTIENYDSDIYITEVENSKICGSKTPLLYMNRTYGVFKDL